MKKLHLCIRVGPPQGRRNKYLNINPETKMSGEEVAAPAPVVETAAPPLGEAMDLMTEDCNQPDYVKLVKGLCADHNVSLLTVPSAKTLGEWAGLCKIDSEGKARKVVGCSCVVVKDWGDESDGLNVVQQHLKAH
ncbi:hypothetical protein LWI29_025367 [Acer saccharum]|uniref:40S ribosomal protein S12 n=1 Tax=Acer saccharum TaxID=4024 RepID=A0AA39RT06_ACESA|nr:hypothetical protein LWI29_025367 [Acer saccharum]